MDFTTITVKNQVNALVRVSIFKKKSYEKNFFCPSFINPFPFRQKSPFKS